LYAYSSICLPFVDVHIRHSCSRVVLRQRGLENRGRHAMSTLIEANSGGKAGNNIIACTAVLLLVTTIIVVINGLTCIPPVL